MEPTQRFRDGATLLHCVVGNDAYDGDRNIKILQLLLEYGANTKLVDRGGKVPFVVANGCYHLLGWRWVDPVRSTSWAGDESIRSKPKRNYR